MNVLIADDNPQTRNQLTELVTLRLKHRPGVSRIRSTTTIFEARQALAEGFEPDVVFCATSLGDAAYRSIAELSRGRNPQAYVCFMSDDFDQIDEADITLCKSDLHIMVTIVLGKAKALPDQAA